MDPKHAKKTQILLSCHLPDAVDSISVFTCATEVQKTARPMAWGHMNWLVNGVNGPYSSSFDTPIAHPPERPYDQGFLTVGFPW